MMTFFKLNWSESWSFLVHQLQNAKLFNFYQSPIQLTSVSTSNNPSTSTIYVEPTSRIHASRPAGFGPHFENPDGQLMNLLPIESFNHPINTLTNDPQPDPRRGCPPAHLATTFTQSKAVQSTNVNPYLRSSPSESLPTSTSTPEPPPNWVALVERGTCAFVDKIRYAQHLGASAVIVGDWDQAPNTLKGTGPVFYTNPLGGDKFGFGSGLVTMYAPGDTSDLEIPSVFVARDSYLSLHQDWLSLNSRYHPGDSSPNSIDGHHLSHHNLPHPLEVVMSKDELWTWPFFDLLIILLFLPSILTAVTLVLHRINLFRKRRADRAPQEFVDRLPCVVWAKDMEKGIPVVSESNAPESDSTPETNLKVVTPRLGWVTETRQAISRKVSAVSRPLLRRRTLTLTESENTPLLGSNQSLRSALQFDQSSPAPKVYFAQRECALCLSDFEVGDLVRILPCGHCFHQGEIENNCMGIDCWLVKSKRVVCR
ncbi:hypothetical protein CROQUDRAFT_658965 [Cronartium quercuum f. sp. fusiforme G11]|uniref:RING-type domain-containing protein n=1 Tax=Cronartium quercuum f. sp. fusiforme G11 TaxID=708437 RepID=A0A9P6NGH6_9BASI|nr:hypothetical protein CROQUDRAFT_658965 [Cronartium quercuum f. sp. fusiforme G11]